jgi:glutathione S-transferase
VKYLGVEEGRALPGLRLVLTAGVPGPWGEAAKAIFRVKGLGYAAIAQEGGGENTALREWTGHANAPTAVNEDEAPVSDSLEILFLAERLAPTPRLIPADPAERAAMFGIAREIIGRDGLGWERRHMMLAPLMRSPAPPEGILRLGARYGWSEAAARGAGAACARILDFLARTLAEQSARGSRYFVGDALSAADLYWACFSNMLAPLPPEACPTPPWMRQAWAETGPEIAASLTPALLAHRDFVLAEHVGLPLDFLPD